MAQVRKIDSNITGLAYAEEAALGLLAGETGAPAGTPVWNRLNPNSYSDFGAEVTTVAPNPINPSRQRQKGAAVDLDPSGGLNHNLDFFSLRDLMQGFMFADERKKGTQRATAVTSTVYNMAATAGFVVGSLVFSRGYTNAANNGLKTVTAVTANTSIAVAGLTAEASPPAGALTKVVGITSGAGDLDVTTTGAFATITSTTLNFTTLGLVPGQWIYVGGDATLTRFSTAANNGWKRIRSVATNALVIDKSAAAMVTEANTAQTVHIFFGDVLRNETGTLIKRRSYNIERTLGAPDDAQAAQIQSEVLVGAVPSEWTLNIPTAELANTDITFVATDNQQRTGATGPKQTSVQNPPASAVYNTSSDVAFFHLATVDASAEVITPLFAFVTEATMAINNNLEANKAVSVFGAFDITAGTFTVTGSMTAYFSNVTAVQAVRNSADVTYAMGFIKQNKGVVYDMPLTTLGDGRLNVEIDQPITLPLTVDAATGETISPDLNHTMLVSYFDYLPNIAAA